MEMKLVNGKRQTVKIGDRVRSGRERVSYVVVGWEAPRHINSSGRIYVKPVGERGPMSQSYFPHVFGCRFISAAGLVAKVKTLAELCRLARSNDRYNRLMMVAAENL